MTRYQAQRVVFCPRDGEGQPILSTGKPVRHPSHLEQLSAILLRRGWPSHKIDEKIAEERERLKPKPKSRRRGPKPPPGK